MWSSKREPFPSPCMVLSMRLLTLGAGTVTGSRATATAGIQAACTEDGYSSDFLKEQTVLQPKVNANTFFFSLSICLSEMFRPPMAGLDLT